MSISEMLDGYEVPEVFTGYGPSEQFGKVTATMYVLRLRKGEPRSRVTVEEYVSEHGKDSLKDQPLEISFKVDIQEFNPGLSFQYVRDVRIEKGKLDKTTGETVKTDYEDIVLPSLIAAFKGKKWEDEIENHPYVEVVDEPSHREPWQRKDPATGQLMTNNEGKPVMIRPNTIKFLRVFKNREECVAAREERYGSSSTEGSSGIPADVVETAKTLYTALGKNDANFKMAVENDERLSQYDYEVLKAAAVPF